ncbi:MAG: hypothetical protein II715_01870 [Clostridia bacterium]|nr:hypothetical protein [Clostridia bacterium]
MGHQKSLVSRALCLLAAAVLLLGLTLVSCGGPEQPSAGETSAQTSEESREEALVPSLGKADYSGKSLRVLTTGKKGLYPFGYQAFGAEENDEAEPVNEACLSRNALLEREYGFTLTTEFSDEWKVFSDRIENDYMAGTVTYDIVSSGLITVAGLAAEGFFKNLYNLPGSHLDLKAKWWDVAANEDMSIGNRLYFTTGDILQMDDEFTRCVFYNKGIVRDYNLGDLPTMVYDGKWTLDEMYRMMKEVAHENDDGVMDIYGNDVWGCVSNSFELWSLVLGCDCPQVEKDQNDYPVLAMMNERNVNAWLKAFEMITDKERYAYTETYYRYDDPDAHLVRDQFTDGKALFHVGLINNVNAESFREANIYYGILPMPKYDDNQPNYATPIDPYHFYVVAIMNDCQNIDFVTFALEALAYTSRELVTPEYYERTLKNKRFLDDDDSPRILDIIFSNRLVDISVAFNWDDCIQYYNQTIWNGSPELASTLESKIPAFNAAMQKTIDYFAALDS